MNMMTNYRARAGVKVISRLVLLLFLLYLLQSPSLSPSAEQAAGERRWGRASPPCFSRGRPGSCRWNRRVEPTHPGTAGGAAEFTLRPTTLLHSLGHPVGKLVLVEGDDVLVLLLPSHHPMRGLLQ